MAGTGGKRAGAGRKKGSVNKATIEIKALAQKHAPDALKKLKQLMNGKDVPAATQRAAANDILDRAYGKPAQVLAGDKDNPVEFSLKLILSDINEKEPRIPDDD